MGALKKYQDFFKDKDTQNETSDKQQITAYQEKISDLLESDPKMQKKAAEILSSMINQKK